MPDGPPLARVTWDRAGLHRNDDAWLADAWSRARVLLISPGSETPVDGDGRVQLRPSDEAPDGPRRLLGIVDDVPTFAVTAAPDGDNWRTLRDVGGTVGDLSGGLLATAIGLEQWHAKHPHCPRCGALTHETQAGWTRTCPVDGSHHFPRTDPAVIMLVHDGGDLALLGRGPKWNPGRFSTLAGFVEPGETLEGAVAREVFEEVGVVVQDVRYVASQPWPFPASLMLGFTARLVGDPALTLDPVEMAEAGWFTREEIRRAADWADDDPAVRAGDRRAAADARPDGTRLVAVPPPFSISRYLIDRWLAGES
ncbi:NAD(+) diphosphatase [uncultured Jatrophihabitans sp.]|uniref:NAD(+) diphosphatase n=1 Tax=uncultured Jatrophihabitans sp. TaxID=1610747 RepID=UPI0035CABCDA